MDPHVQDEESGLVGALEAREVQAERTRNRLADALELTEDVLAEPAVKLDNHPVRRFAALDGMVRGFSIS